MNDDLISRQSIMDKLCAKSNEWRGSYSGDAYATAARMVKKEPAVDAVEVVHGRWDDDGRCTRCGRYMPFDCEGNAYESIYCPDCGAVMTGR